MVSLARSHPRARRADGRGGRQGVCRGACVTVLTRIAERLRGEGGLLADAVVAPQADHPAWEPVEAIREGYLLHHGEARIVATDDQDLALLAGDRLYALGLADLAEMGDPGAGRPRPEGMPGQAF